MPARAVRPNGAAERCRPHVGRGPSGAARLPHRRGEPLLRAPATGDEVDAALRDDPSDDLAPPRGALLVAVEDGAVLGCAGLRLLPDGVAEVTRVYVAPAARRRGLGASLVTEVERLARAHGARTLRLDTRADLVEARRLYARAGVRRGPGLQPGPVRRALVRQGTGLREALVPVPA